MLQDEVHTYISRMGDRELVSYAHVDHSLEMLCVSKLMKMCNDLTSLNMPPGLRRVVQNKYSWMV